MTPQTNQETRYKFIVASAEEAVKVLRERLGENARVISVRQVEGAGLAKFLRAPKLEVIAQVNAPEPAAEPVPEPVPEPAPATPQVAEPPSEPPKPEPRPAASNRNISSKNDLARILQSGGITETMLARLRANEAWPKIARLPLREALTEIAVLLRYEYQHHAKRPVGNCVAFLGTAGAGKTTALCKRLAMDVFLNNDARLF